MGASVTLQNNAPRVQPGSVATITVLVRNTGTVVDQMTIDVLGAAASWSSVEPATLSLFPGAEDRVTVTFRPPRDPNLPTGQTPFGVRAQSKEDPAGSAVSEGMLTVDPYSDTFAELIPHTSRGRRGATHELAIDNRGNAALNAKVLAVDPDNQLVLTVDPPALSIPAGAAAFVKIKAKPTKRFLRGSPKSLPFTVLVESDGDAPQPVAGTMLQESLIPRWVPKALMALLALLVLATIAWFTWLKPHIKSEANDAIAEAVKDGTVAAGAGAGGGGGGGGGGATTTTATTASTETTVPGQTTTTNTSTPPTTVRTQTPVDGRLQVGADPAKVGGPTTFAVPDGQVLSVTDLVLQNPNGDIGQIQILRGDQVLLSVDLATFRTYDLHYVTPYVFKGGQQLNVKVNCQNAPPKKCDVAVSYSGTQAPA